MLGGQPTGKPETTRFVWEGSRLLQELHGDVPLTYVYSDQDSYDPLARIDGADAEEIFWFHCQPNGTPERMTDSEGQVRWEGVNSAWGKLLRESETQLSGYSQNLRMDAGAIPRSRDRAALQSVPVLRPGLRTVYAAGPDRGGGGDKPLPVCAECAEIY